MRQLESFLHGRDAKEDLQNLFSSNMVVCVVMHQLVLYLSKCVAKEVKLLVQAVTLGDWN